MESFGSIGREREKKDQTEKVNGLRERERGQTNLNEDKTLSFILSKNTIRNINMYKRQPRSCDDDFKKTNNNRPEIDLITIPRKYSR